MTVHYAGQKAADGHRVAEILFDTDTETELLNRLVFFLETVKGWEGGSIVDGWYGLEVEDHKEYEDFARDYKVAKRMITNCMKYGF